MASVLKVSVAAGLLGLASLAAILGWYFSSVGAPSTSFYLEGEHDDGSLIRFSADNLIGLASYEIIINPLSATEWTVAKSVASESAILYSIAYGDTEWTCFKQAGASSTGAASAGQALFNVPAEGGYGLVKLQVGDKFRPIPVAVSPSGITNFGGYKVTTFTFGVQEVQPFKTGLPSLPSASTCTDLNLESEKASLEAWTNKWCDTLSPDNTVPGYYNPDSGTCKPLCASPASIYAFMSKLVYKKATAMNFCVGLGYEFKCNAVYDNVNSPGDFGMKCTSNALGTIVSFTGTSFALGDGDAMADLMVGNAAFAIPSAPLLDANGKYTTTKGTTTLRVHAGFLGRWESYRTWALNQIAGASKVCFNGHSMGGSVAMLGAIFHKAQNPNKIVYLRTFGTPAAVASAGFQVPSQFREAWKAWTEIDHYRYVNHYNRGNVVGNQFDAVAAATGPAGYVHANEHPIRYNVYNPERCDLLGCKAAFYTNTAIATNAITGGDLTFGLHDPYPTYTDGARPTGN